MNKLKQKISFLVFSIIIILSVTITPLAYIYEFFPGKRVTDSQSHLSENFYTYKGTFKPFVSINKVNAMGKVHITLPQLLADGSYGGGAGDVKTVTKFTEGLLFSLDVNANHHKLKISGRDGLDIILNFVRLEV